MIIISTQDSSTEDHLALKRERDRKSVLMKCASPDANEHSGGEDGHEEVADGKDV